MRSLSPATDRLILTAGFLFLYLGWLSSRYNFDGVVFAFFLGKAVAGDPGFLWHPHHLLYGHFTYGFYRLISPAGLSYIASMQTLNALFGAAALFVFHRLATEFLRDRIAALCATAGLGASYAFWFYSIEPEVYVPHCFFVLVGLALALDRESVTETGAGSEKDQNSGLGRAVGCGLTGAMIAATHISGLAFGPGILLAQLWPSGSERPRLDRPGALRALLAAAVMAVALVGMYAVGVADNPQAREAGAWAWVLGRTDPGTGDVTRGGHWVWPPDSCYRLAEGFVRALSATPAAGWAATALMAGFAGSYLWSLRARRRGDRRRTAVLAAYYLPAFAFFSVFEPANYEMKVVLLPLLWLAAGAGAGVPGRWQIPRRALLAAFPVVLLAVNFFGAILPGADPANNQDLARARFIGEHTEPNAVIYISGYGEFASGKIYILYFGGRQTRIADWIINTPDPAAALARSLEADRGRPVYLTRDLADPGSKAFQELAARHHVTPQRLAAVFAGRLKPVGEEHAPENSGPLLFRYFQPAR